MSNLHIPAAAWLAETFEYEYCAECQGGALHHEAIPFLGNWFARCCYPPANDDDATPHPCVQAYHAAVLRCDPAEPPA